MRPIYEPSGKAKEYGDLAINIYTGCPHRCYYCFAPNTLHRVREEFHSHVEPRRNIVEETRRQIEREGITGKTIHLCFLCDPYPVGYDTTPTREIIKLLKETGNYVQILTKGDGSRDFDLLKCDDWYGISYTGADTIRGMEKEQEPCALDGFGRLCNLLAAKRKGIRTWVSFEPVIEPIDVLETIENCHSFIDMVRIGKLNYWPSNVNWAEFGRQAEALCQKLGLAYAIKKSLREEMEGKSND